MKPKTEEFLYFLLWSTELLTRPTVRNLTDSYEAWAYRHGLLRQTGRLEAQGFIERAAKNKRDRLYRLTELGRLHALGGRDPTTQWARRWDGQWRIVLFDVPVAQNVRRESLRRYLRMHGFGCLQGSVWITPNPLTEEQAVLEGGDINVRSLILLEARPCAGERDSQLVLAAWDFEEINQRYALHMEGLTRRPEAKVKDSEAAKELQRWAAAERQAWFEAVSIDPLLPECLHQPDYLGPRAWKQRVEVLSKAGEQMKEFKG